MSGPGDRAPKSATLGNGKADTLPRGGRPGRESDKCGPGRRAAPGSDEFGTFGMLPAREPGDLDDVSLPMVDSRQPREGDEPQAVGKVVEESDAVIGSKKSAKTRVT